MICWRFCMAQDLCLENMNDQRCGTVTYCLKSVRRVIGFTVVSVISQFSIHFQSVLQICTESVKQHLVFFLQYHILWTALYFIKIHCTTYDAFLYWKSVGKLFLRISQNKSTSCLFELSGAKWFYFPSNMRLKSLGERRRRT